MKRGRKTQADLNVIIGGFGKPEADPPDTLSKPQAAIWRAVVATESPGFFASDVLRAMLADYCRHRESGEKISAFITEFEAEWFKTDAGVDRYKTLIRMRELETRAATTLATKLRLTNQSRYVPHTAAREARDASQTQSFKAPWETS